ncbi:MAG: hypothetical protein ABSD73_07040 [Candidatus Bathyarchaeia archaeon]|jgi:hypothetical protein
MVSKKQLVQITEAAIDRLIKTFRANPYFFYTENDLHCHLFSEIFSRLQPRDWQCKTMDNKNSILLHKEYPTKARYVARTPAEVSSGGARGHFDLCIWNPDTTGDRLFRALNSNFQDEQHTFIGIEFDMIEGNRTLESALHHFRWDLLKLRGEKNEVEHGYQFAFVRDWLHKDNFITKARNEAAEAKNTTVLYIEKDKDCVDVIILSPRPLLKYGPIGK